MINICISILCEIFKKIYKIKLVNLRVRLHTCKHFNYAYNERAHVHRRKSKKSIIILPTMVI